MIELPASKSSSHYPISAPASASAGGVRIISQRTEVHRTEFKGPIPSPEILTGYEAICHGAASRIISMAERAQDHKCRLEQRAADYLDRDQMLEASIRRWGMLCAFTLAVGSMAGAAYSLYIGQTGGALGFGVGGAALLAKLFLTGKNDEGANDSEEQGVAKPKTTGNAGGTSQPKRRKR